MEYELLQCTCATSINKYGTCAVIVNYKTVLTITIFNMPIKVSISESHIIIILYTIIGLQHCNIGQCCTCSIELE